MDARISSLKIDYSEMMDTVAKNQKRASGLTGEPQEAIKT